MAGTIVSLNLRLAWQQAIRQWWRIALGVFVFLFMCLYLLGLSSFFLFAGISEGSEDLLLLATVVFPLVMFLFVALGTLAMGVGDSAVSPRQLAVFVSPQRQISTGLLLSIFLTPFWLGSSLFGLTPLWFHYSHFGVPQALIYGLVFLLAHATLGVYLQMWRIREQLRATVRSTAKKQSITAVLTIIMIAGMVGVMQLFNTYSEQFSDPFYLLTVFNQWSDSFTGLAILGAVSFLPGLAPLVALYAFYHGNLLLLAVGIVLSGVTILGGLRRWYSCVSQAMRESTSPAQSALAGVAPEQLPEFLAKYLGAQEAAADPGRSSALAEAGEHSGSNTYSGTAGHSGSAMSTSSAGHSSSAVPSSVSFAHAESWGSRIILNSRLGKLLMLSRGGQAILGQKLIYAVKDPRLILQLVMPLYCSIIFGFMIMGKDAEEAFIFQEMFLILTPVISGMVLLNLWIIPSSALWYQLLAPVSPWEERHSWVILFLPISFLTQLAGFLLANWYGQINYFDLLFLFGNTLFSLAVFALLSFFLPLPGAAPGENVFRNNFGKKGSYALLAILTPLLAMVILGGVVTALRVLTRMLLSAELSGVAMTVIALSTYPLFMYLCQLTMRKRGSALLQRILSWPGHKYTN